MEDNFLKAWAIVGLVAAAIAIAVIGTAYSFDHFRSDPIETHRACYEESFGAGTVPTSKEIPCP